MKTRILSFLIMALGLMVSTSAFAQPSFPLTGATPVSTQQAEVGGTYTYSFSVTSGNAEKEYHWQLTAETGVTNDGSSVTSGTSADGDISITWDEAADAETYYLDVYMVDENNCYSEGIRVRIDLSSGSITFDDDLALACSDLTSIDGGDASDESSDIITYQVTYSGLADLATIAFEITDNSGASWFTTSLGSAAANTTYNQTDAAVTITGKTATIQITANYKNTTTGDVNFKVNVVDATTTTGADVVSSDIPATLTVYPVPVISFN